MPTDRSHEPGVLRMLRQVFCLEGRIQSKIPARQHGHREAVLLKKGLQLRRLVGEAIHGRGTKLDAFETERRDVLDGLDVISAPGNGGVAKGNPGGCAKGRRGRGGARRQQEVPASSFHRPWKPDFTRKILNPQAPGRRSSEATFRAVRPSLAVGPRKLAVHRPDPGIMTRDAAQPSQPLRAQLLRPIAGRRCMAACASDVDGVSLRDQPSGDRYRPRRRGAQGARGIGPRRNDARHPCARRARPAV